MSVSSCRVSKCQVSFWLSVVMSSVIIVCDVMSSVILVSVVMSRHFENLYDEHHNTQHNNNKKTRYSALSKHYAECQFMPSLLSIVN